jgi:hypothetical protein
VGRIWIRTTLVARAVEAVTAARRSLWRLNIFGVAVEGGFAGLLTVVCFVVWFEKEDEDSREELWIL